MNSKRQFDIALINSNYARIILNLLSKYDIDYNKLINDSNIPFDILNIDKEFIPHESLKKLISLIGTQLEDYQFIDLVITAIRNYSIPNIISYFSNCKNVFEALEYTKKVYKLESTYFDVGLDKHYGDYWYWCKRDFELTPSFIWSEVWTIVYLIELIRALTKTNWTPKKVKIQSNDIDIYKKILCSSTQYYLSNHRIELLIEDGILKTQLNIPINNNLDDMSSMEWHASYTDRVFTTLLPYAKEQDITLEYAAKLLRISSRTLQRRLNEEKTNFRIIKNNIILTIAIEMMENEYSITYISNQLGFSDTAHFSRSFKKVSGLTPREYKKLTLNLVKK